jgi:hypothetical protein
MKGKGKEISARGKRKSKKTGAAAKISQPRQQAIGSFPLFPFAFLLCLLVSGLFLR